jgi:hypothetical protein
MESSPIARPPVLSDPEILRLITESLKASGSARYHLRGDSMLPTLREGWTLQVRALPAGELRVGDIGLFVHRGLLAAHRLIWKVKDSGGERFIFQGDNNPAREIVDTGAILGRVEAAEGEKIRDGLPLPLPLRDDGRAFFYRTAYRLHSFVSRHLPGAALPRTEGAGGLAYRCLRACFLLLEQLFSPHPRR